MEEKELTINKLVKQEGISKSTLEGRVKQAEKKIKLLEKELNRKGKTLDETVAWLVFSKKYVDS